ncbi:MAG: DMT family transporter [Duncaniella sp.]|nr:DMT family transporter [Duncaniella sp.]
MINEVSKEGKQGNVIRGYVLGIIAAVSYGTNPMFAIPLYGMGLSVASVLFYRYIGATAVLGIIMLLSGKSFRLPLRDVIFMIGEGVIFALSSLLLFVSYNYMDVGIATTLLFMTPVCVTLIMWLGYGEKLIRVTVAALCLSVAGIACLYNPSGGTAGLIGILLVCLSSLAYAVYMVAINKSRLRDVPGMTLTFYSLLFGSVVFVINLDFLSDLSPIVWNADCIVNIAGIALVPTIISLLAITVSVRDVGSVVVSLLGALEPVTGIIIGVCMFGETLSLLNITGVVLIVVSVTLVVIGPRLRHG